MSKLVIIRGNSGSGKTTVAKALQAALPPGKVMRISQDEVRRGMLNVRDRIENPTVELLRLLVTFGQQHASIVVLEGILSSTIYKAMLLEVSALFDQYVYTYYYDISFEETLVRHSQRKQVVEFGREQMERWWLEKDLLEFPNEKTLTVNWHVQDVVRKILHDLEINVKDALL